MFLPAAISIPPALPDRYSDPGVQSERVSTPKLYFRRCSGSVIASHSRSGLVLMKTSNTAVPPATGAVPSAHETFLTVCIVSSSKRVLSRLSVAAHGSAYLLTHRSWTSRIGTVFR